MTMPIAGSWMVDVEAVRPFTIHGDVYYEMQVVRRDEPSGASMLLRIAQHASPRPPRPGDKLKVTFLMGQVTSAMPMDGC